MLFNFSVLLSEACRQGDLTPIKQVDPWLLTEMEVQAQLWVMDQHAKFGSMPTFQMLRDHPDHGVLATMTYSGVDLRLALGNTLDYLVKRKAEMGMSELAELAELEGSYPITKLSAMVQRLRGIGLVDHESLVDADLDAIFAQKELEKGLDFGFTGLDTSINSILPGEVCLLAARTGVGKSAIVCHVAPRWALAGKRVLLVSCEMPPAALMQRMYGFLGGFNPKLFRQADEKAQLDSMVARTKSAVGDIAEAGGDIVFPRDRSLTLQALETGIVELRPDVVIVDGVYLLRASTVGRDAASWERTKAASNALKQMALEYQLPFFTTTQFKRAGKDDDFDLEDLAYSDALGQDADIVISAIHDETCHTAHRLLMEVIKNRSGEMGGRSQVDVNWGTGKVSDVPFTNATLALKGKATT